MATIKDIAKLAGVSVSTVSYALNGHDKVSPATRQKVRAAAEQLNYQKNGMASDLKSSRTQTVVLIIEDLAGPFFSEFIHGVQHAALDNGYSLIACSAAGGRDSTGAKFMREKRADGAIVFCHDIHDELILESARKGFPIVLIDRDVRSDDLVTITVDNQQGACLACEHLIRMGHIEIAYISGTTGSYDNLQRFLGYQKTLEAHGLKPFTHANISGWFTRDGGYRATKVLLAQGRLPSAVFFANDEMAIGGLKAFSEEGIRVPDDISVVGYDDILLSQYVNPMLTTVRQPKYEMGTLAVHLLLRHLAQEDTQKHYTLGTELIERNSCKSIS